MVLFQALNWTSEDVEGEHLIRIFGRTDEGQSVCVTSAFKPYFFVKLPKTADGSAVRNIYSKINNACSGCVETYQLVKAKDLWGFQNNEKSAFMKLNFSTLKAMRICNSKLYKPLSKEDTKPLKVYEANLDPVLRFMHRTNIKSTGWLDSGDSCVRANLTKCDIDLFCNNWTTLKPVDRDDVAPFVVASFDIETYSSTGKFPDANIPEDCVFQAAFTLRLQGDDEIYDKTCLCYKQTSDNLEGCNVVSFETERDLLMGIKDYIVRNDIDIITGWNIFGFDLEYIFTRSVITGCSDEFLQLGRIKNEKTDLLVKKLSSSALGDNLLKMLPMSGRFIFDLFHEVKREQKLDSYSLNHVSSVFLGDNKIDMPPKEMFVRYREENPDKLAEVAEYCIKDTILPHRLMDKLCTLLNLLEMAKATWVPINYLAERGQQIKVFSQVTRAARSKGYMVPTIRYGSIPPEQYEGATVLEAHVGAHYKPITALDFEGLYPSIMMAHNLCYSTLVLDPKYDNIPGVTYERFEIEGKTYKFAQDVESLIPGILAELKAFRKQAKKDMAKSTGQMKQVYNGKQLAYKISMNSVYGFTGAGKGMLPCVAIAATVTREGRHMIEQTKELVEREFEGAIVRYGDTDSVMVEFDVGNRTGIEAIEYSWKLGEIAAQKCNELFKKPKNLELEKVYWPYILYSKKRYAAKMWTQDRQGNMNMDYIDVKGLQLVRRDNIKYVREVSKDILDMILDSNDPEPAKKLAQEKAKELLDGKVDMDKLILSQKLADSYKNNNLAHVRVRDKMREREPGSEPQSGDRVQYVLVKTDGSKTQGDKAEDPKWAERHALPLDYDYYFTNKFMNPICDLLEPLVENPKESIFGELIKSTKKPRKSTKKNGDIANLFNKYKQKNTNNTK
jgi:DNA polymerase delta subunit 1